MKKHILPLLLVMCALLLLVEGGIASDKENAVSKKRTALLKATGVPAATLLNINKISAWYESNGEMERDPATTNAGLTYPRGTSTAIYASGLVWGGKVIDGKTPIIRAGGSDYNRGVQPGAILGTLTGKYEDASDANVRIWRIRRDYATADLRQDAAEMNTKAIGSVTDGDIAAVRKQYEKDWKEWPVSKGAPFYNRDGAAGYQPKFKADKVNDVSVPDLTGFTDEPGVADGDQVIWFVCHDLSGPSQWASPPIGLEQQTTIWGYNRSDALGNVVFKKFKLIYKGTLTSGPTAKINDMYVCQWSDPDLGDAGDDFAGCDTTLSLGYVYNSNTLDKSYHPFNIAPPASGYDFLQGPLVTGVAGQDLNKNGVDDAADYGIFDLKIVGPGKLNLPMTSFIYFAAGGKYTDPPHTAPGAIQWYQMLRGLPPTPQGPPDPPQEVDPTSNKATSFWLPGDPVTGKGWIDGMWDTPGDRRMLLSSGPFNMAIGDTQEIVSATLAGLGSDSKSSVSVLKFYDQSAQSAYDNIFDLPKPPPAPKFSIVELDKSLIIEWEKDTVAVNSTEQSNSKGYKFEGYNVWQLPTATSPLSNGVRIATYDLESDPSTITQQEFDQVSGQILSKPVQLGKNSGLSRYMLLTTDAIKNRPFINGQRYYFAVTAYNYNGDPLKPTHSYECSPGVQEAIPHVPNAGIVQPYKTQDSLESISSSNVGSSFNDAKVGIVVFNPTLQMGNTYEVWYGGSVGTAIRNYTLVKTISGSTDYATINAKLTDANQNVLGSGTFTLNDAKDQIEYSVSYTSLSGPPTAAYIYKGESGKVGTAVKTLTFPFGKSTDSISVVGSDTTHNVKKFWKKIDAVEPLTDPLVSAFIAGNLYVNIHTGAKPAGELRGQTSDGLFPRTVLAPAVAGALPPVTSNTEHRIPNDGISFYASPAPLGVKDVQQTAPTSGKVLNTPNPSSVYSIVGPVDSLNGAKGTEADFTIKFNSDVNYAVAVRADTISNGATAKFIQVPFAVYNDTVRVWPIIKVVNNTDTLWNADSKNPKINNKLTFDKILGVADTITGTFVIKYYSPSFPSFPPNTTLWKSRLIAPANHHLRNITFVSEKSDSSNPAAGTIVKISTFKSVKIGDVRSFTMKAVETNNQVAAKAEVNNINVYPNPYYGLNNAETSREVRFVTINHLPKKATIRIFSLAGTLVFTAEKNDVSQFYQWNLANQKGLPVASGIYIIHVDMGDLGVKVLKSAIIQEQQFLRNY